MKNKLHSFISILLTLIFVVGLMPLTSIPAAAKSNIPVVMSTANGDIVEWSSKVGSNDGYWEIYAENDDYHVLICSGVTDHEAGSYAWSDLQGDLCGLTVKSTSTDVAFTNCSDCTVTVNGTVINVSGIFTGDNGEYYAVDITYGTPAAVTEWHVGDPINLGGKYYINDDQGAPPSYGFDRDVIVSEPVYETMYNQWIFENVIAYNASGAFALYISLPTGKTASDVPTGFKVKSGDGTEASPYEFELVYAAAASTVSFTKVDQASDIAEENIGTCTFDEAKAWAINNYSDIAVNSYSDIVFSDGTDIYYFCISNAWTVDEFSSTIDANAVYQTSVSSLQTWLGDGDDVYLCTGAAAASGKFVVTISKDNSPYVGYIVDTTATFDCNSQGTGLLDQFLKIILSGDPMGSGVSANIAPTVTGGNGAVVAGLNNGYQYLTINERFDGDVTVSGKYYLGTEENDYTFTIACSDFVPVEGVSISPDTAQEIEVGGTVAITPTVTPDEAYEFGVLVTVGGTNSGAVALYADADCNYPIPPIIPSGMPFYVKGVSAGTATVTITSPEDEQFTASVTVTVTAATAYAGYVPTANDDADALAAKVVKFNGYDWYLIEDNSTSETEGTVTLFAKDTIGSSRFDNSSNVYSGSMVQSYLDNLTAEGGAFADVADAIVSTALEDVTVTGAKLWLLSKDEVVTTYKLSTALNKCSNDWWLRTPVYSSYVYFVNGESGSVDNNGNMNTYGVRPALKLDLSKVEFDSETNTFALPATVTEYPLWVGGVQVTSANAMDTTAHPTWSYAADTHTLTLNGYTNSGTARADIQSGVNNAAIYYDDNMSSPNPLTIQLAEGTTNSLTMTGDRVYGIYVFGSALTITGNGTLNVQSEEMAINDAWGVAITGGTVNAASSEYYGIGSVTIGADISSVTVTGKLGAIYGGSNEDQALINAVAGTGWTDTAGTTGETDIAISTTGQNVSSYLKVQFPAVEYVLSDGLWIGETEVTDTVTSGEGWSYDASTNTLTLNGYDYWGYGHPFSKTMNSGLYYKGTTPLNIVLEGRSWIILNDEWVSGSGYNYRSVGIYAEGGVKFSGTGYLSVSGSLGGIIGDATVDGCELYISADSNSKDGCAGVTNLTVNSGKVTVHGGDTLSGGYVGGYAVETLTVNGGIVYVYGGNAYNSSSAVPQSAVKTLTVNGGVLYAKSGYSSYGSYSIPAVAATADGGSITVGTGVKVYGGEIQSSYDYDMPNTLIEEEDGDFDRFFYMIFEGPSVEVTVPYKDHEWTDGALVTTDKEMTCNTVTFAMGTEWSGNYYADHNVTLGSEKEPVTITLTGDTNIVLSDTATLYVYGTVDCGDYTLNVYGNEQGHGGYSKAMYETGRFTINNTSETALSLGGDTFNVHGGTVTVQCSGEYDDTPVVLEVENLSVYAGSLEVRSSGEKGLSAVACDNTNVYGGGLYVQGGNGKDDVDGGAGFFGALTVYGGYVNAYGGDVYGEGTGNGGSGMSGDVTVYGGQISASGGYSSGGVGGVAFVGTVSVYGGIFDADGGYDSNDDRNYAISGTVTLGEGVAYFEGEKYDLFAEGPVEEMESGTAGYAQIKGGVKYVYVDQTTGEVTTAYAYDAESRINSWLWSKWYIVEKDTTISDAVYFDTDEVNIIIADGVTLTFANGLNVPEGKTLKIYAQSMDEATMGTLIATGANGAAGIGGENGGNVCIYSGTVEATGDTGAAGIDGTVYIYGGSVTATGGEGSVGINGDLTVGDGVTLYGDDDVNPPTTVIEEESGNYHRTQYMKTVSGPATATISGTPTAATNLTYTGSALVLITADPTVTGGTVKYSIDQQNWYTRENFKVTAAGTYNVYYYVAGDDNHDDSEVFGGETFTVTVDPKEITVTAEEKTKTYGDADPALTYTVEGLIDGDVLMGALTRAAGDGVGTYAITQGTLASSNNYTISFTDSTLTVNAKEITVTAEEKTKTYGTDDPELTYKVSGLVGTDALTGALARAEGENVGTYAITQGTLAAGGNYTMTFTGSTLTVGKRTVTITAEGKSKMVGDKDPELTYRTDGLVAGDVPTGALARAEGETEGKYAITQGTLAVGENYTIVFVEGTLTIRSADSKVVKITATAATKTYGDKDPVLTYTVEGLAEGDALTGALARAEGENVGTYAITIGTLTAGDKYVIEFTGATLTVNAKEITVKANAATKAYGSADPALTYTVEGLVSGDALTGALARAEGEAVGSYAITQGTLAASENYTLKFEGAEFTIAAMIINVTADDQRKVVGAADPELTYKVEGIEEAVIITGELAREAGETEGTYAITQGTLAVGGNYAIRFTGATLTIYEPHVETDVNIDEDAPDMEVEGIDEEVAGSLLTEEEKEALENGEEVKIYLEVIAVDEEIVPQEDKTEIEKEAEKSGMKVGMYLDMSLLKKVGENDAVAIHDTEGNMVKVTVTVPENLRNTNPNVKRTFYVVRVHDGKTEVLGQSTSDTVSFETDKFSTYSLTYKDDDSTEETKSGSLTWLWIVLAVVAVAAAGVAVFFIIKKRNGCNAPTDNTDKTEKTEEPEKTDE